MPDVYRILKSSLDDIADAIRAKTGGTGSLTPAQMVTEIGSIETGGSLPSVISKIDGGSFTLTSDTVGTSYWISHNLGVPPRELLSGRKIPICGRQRRRLHSGICFAPNWY